MFEQTFVDGTGKTNKPWTVLVSFLLQIGLIAIAVLIPLIYFDALPKTQLSSFLVAPPPPPPPPPPPAAVVPKVVKVIPRQFDAGKLMAPKVIPKKDASRLRKKICRQPRRAAAWSAACRAAFPAAPPAA